MPDSVQAPTGADGSARAARGSKRSLARGLLGVSRPRQWVKNLLVLAAPGAAGLLTRPHDLLVALGAFGIFCLAASGTYFINDSLDAAADRLHPVKRHRPVAAGVVPPSLAATIGAVALLGAIAAAWTLAGGKLALVIAIYALIVTAYSLRLKHEPVLDMACVSSGFVLRAIAGGVATGIPLSVWFLTVTSFGSLLVVAGKRSAEHADLGEGRAGHRPTLGSYPATFLRSVRLLTSSVTATAYCLWAFERAVQDGPGHHPIWFELSVIPFVLGLLILELRFETGHGAAPEELAFTDSSLQALGMIWLVLFASGVYL